MVIGLFGSMSSLYLICISTLCHDFPSLILLWQYSVQRAWSSFPHLQTLSLITLFPCLPASCDRVGQARDMCLGGCCLYHISNFVREIAVKRVALSQLKEKGQEAAMTSCNLSIFDAGSNTYLSLPWTHLAASVTIIDVNARVCLSQTFLNQPAVEGAEAIYTFPLPPIAAVCAFEAIWDDGTSTVGTVLPKEDAKAAYEMAQKAGQQAGLVEQIRADSEIEEFSEVADVVQSSQCVLGTSRVAARRSSN